MGLTVITLAIGFKGGKLIPIFATGATLGAVIAPIFGFNPVFGAAIGVIALFASTTNSLIWPLFFGAEMFGYQYMPFFITVALISYLCNFDSSIYSQKKIDMVKMIEKNYIDPTLNEDIK
jgi:H+/Cl- antiporter ClcA